MSTTIPSGKDIKRKWYVLDASGKTLGRLATHAASVLAGKLNPLYTPYIDMGDHVVIINAEPSPSSVARWPPSSRSTRADSTRTSPSSLSRWKSSASFA